MPMNLLDLFILIPLLYFCYRGIRNGIIGEILGIIGIIAAVFLTFRFMDELADFLSSFVQGNPGYLPFAAAAIIFIGTLIVIQIIASLLRGLFKIAKLNALNKILGLFFGLFKGAIIISVILILLAGFHQPSKQMRDNSVSYSYVIYLAPWAYNTFSGTKFSQTIGNTFQEYNPIKNFPIKQ